MVKEAVLLKSQTVLDMTEGFGNEITFAVFDRELSSPHLNRIEISRAMWEDLGEPPQITVSIEPGDKLNNGNEDDDATDS